MIGMEAQSFGISIFVPMWPVTVIVLILSGVIVTLAVFTCAILPFELKEALSWSFKFLLCYRHSNRMAQGHHLLDTIFH